MVPVPYPNVKLVDIVVSFFLLSYSLLSKFQYRPQHGGQNCPGSSTEVVPCNTQVRKGHYGGIAKAGTVHVTGSPTTAEIIDHLRGPLY